MTAQDLHFFPDYSALNPYQSMLHARLGDVGARAVPVADVVEHLRRRAEGPGDPGVLALHWTSPVLARAGGPFRAKLLLDRFADALDAYAAAGGRLVWTVHNVLPHETRHRWAEVELAQLVGERADVVHVLSEGTLGEVGDRYHLDPAKVVVIEHSGYQGWYADDVAPAQARSRLGLAPDDVVLVALGGIRPYKGLDLLLEVFEGLAAQDPRRVLLVAGRPTPGQTTDRVAERAARHDRVVLRAEHLPDDEVQVWLKAADLAVLPYRAILNSGAFLLAQTFGLPVVAPRAGALRAWEGAEHVRLFDPQDAGSLAGAITSALARVAADPDGLAEHARAAARARPPSAMAAVYAAAVAPLLEPRPALSSGTGPTGSAGSSPPPG